MNFFGFLLRDYRAPLFRKDFDMDEISCELMIYYYKIIKTVIDNYLHFLEK